MADAITEEVLQAVIETKGEISELDVKSFCKDGENFAAIIKEITFKFKNTATKEESNHNVVLKYPCEKGIIYQLYLVLRGYEKETKVYSDFFPNIEKWQQMRFGETRYKLPFPKCFYSDNEKFLFIMENLKIQGFNIEDSPLEGMNYEQSKSVMEQLAIFHALGYAYINSLDTKKEFEERYGYLKVTCEECERSKTIYGLEDEMLGLFKAFTSALTAKYPSDRKILERMQESIVANPPRKQISHFFTESPHFNVLCHGDPWGNNILFRKDENGDLNTMFVDLQAVKYTTPAADLVHFLWISASEYVLSNHIEDLIQQYFKSFEKVLKDLECNPLFTFSELLESVEYMHIMGFWRFVFHCMVVFAQDGTFPTPSMNASDKEKDDLIKQNIEMLKNAGDVRLNHCLFRAKLASSLGIFK